MEQGLSNPQALPCSHLYDSVLCTEIADVNWDGENELVLGTYGKVSEPFCAFCPALFPVSAPVFMSLAVRKTDK